MIYSHKPQRSGRSITADCNNPPQDPPPPKLEKPIIDIPIKDTTPSVPELCIEEPIIIPKPVKKAKIVKEIPQKVSWIKRFLNRVANFLRRK